MKTRLLALPLILAGALVAQGPGGDFRRGQASGAPATPPTPQQIVQRQVDMLTRFFGLTASNPDQVTPVTNALTTQQTCLAGNAANLQSARAALGAAIKGTQGNIGITAALSNLSALQLIQDTCRATAAAAIYAVLNPTQQAKIGDGLGPLFGGGGGFGFGRGPRR